MTMTVRELAAAIEQSRKNAKTILVELAGLVPSLSEGELKVLEVRLREALARWDQAPKNDGSQGAGDGVESHQPAKEVR